MEKPRARHRVSIVGYLCLIVLCVGLFLGKWGPELTEENQIPLAEYNGVLPVATMEALVEQGSFSSQDSFGSNTIEISSDLLAPQILSFSQTGTGITKSGQRLSGGIRVDYVRTLTPWMAQELAREWVSYDRWKNQKYYTDLAVPEGLPADSAFAYSAVFPTLVVTKGNQAVRYMFYQTSETYTMPLEEWGKIVTESLKQNTEEK